MQSTVMILFTIDPFRIGGMEMFTRELARQMETRGIRVVAIFTKNPTGEVADYLRAPNLVLEAVPELDLSECASIGPVRRPMLGGLMGRAAMQGRAGISDGKHRLRVRGALYG